MLKTTSCFVHKSKVFCSLAEEKLKLVNFDLLFTITEIQLVVEAAGTSGD